MSSPAPAAVRTARQRLMQIVARPDPAGETAAQAVRALNERAVDGLLPDRTFYLALGAEDREGRARESGAPLDRVERAGADFMRRVEEIFEELARGEPGRIVRLDAASPPEELAATVRREVDELLYTSHL